MTVHGVFYLKQVQLDYTPAESNEECCAPRRRELKILCQQENRKWLADGVMQAPYSHLKEPDEAVA